MSSKIGLILSLVFVTIFFAFAADIINIQYQYSALDSISVNINYLLANSKGSSIAVDNYLEQNYANIKFQAITSSVVLGEPFVYTLMVSYDPMFMNRGSIMDISIKRSVIIGYLN